MDKLINPGVCNFADLRSSQFREQLILQNRLVIGKSAVFNGVSDILLPADCSRLESRLVI